MGVRDNKQILELFDELARTCEPEQLDQICTPSMTNHALGSHRSPGLAGTKEFLAECRQDSGRAAWMHTMLGQQQLVTIGEGDYVIQYGTRTGSWPGGQFRGYDIPAGDYEYAVAFMYRFEAGRIAERWALRDDLAMIEQLCGTPTVTNAES
jgi:predicted ester cyclase